MASTPKAMWLPKNLRIWIDLYVEHIKKYGHHGGDISKEDHNQVIEAFKKIIGLDYMSS